MFLCKSIEFSYEIKNEQIKYDFLKSWKKKHKILGRDIYSRYI